MPAPISPLAQALNERIASANPDVLAMLAERGKAIYFPSAGILAQSAEAKGKKINATIGTALEDDGNVLALACLSDRVKLSRNDAFGYAPSYGRPEIREAWRQSLYRKNPSLGQLPVSLPVVTCALTHGLSMVGYLFLDPGDRVISPDMYWDNYELVFGNACGASLDTFPTFAGSGFNVAGLRERLRQGPVGKRVVLLNFPNNPTGYTPTVAEGRAICDALVEAAEAGNRVVALIDDAYFGLVYEAGIMTESIFAGLASRHERLLAVKIDGPTKEDYVWGFRVGFLSYAVKGGSPALYKALEDKTAGAVRGNVSNAPMISQSLLLQAWQEPRYEQEKQEKYATLKRRAEKVKEILAAHPEYASQFEALPFNSGYFMCVRLKHSDPETVRRILLTEFSTGVISISGVLRVAFSGAPLGLLEELFANLYQACRKAPAR